MLGSQEAILNACFIIHGQRYVFLLKPGIGKLQKTKGTLLTRHPFYVSFFIRF